jgi:putative chitinase
MKTNVQIQERLRYLGFYQGRIDGDLGPISRAAIKAFQKVEGLVQDGIAGPITLAHLFHNGKENLEGDEGPFTREAILHVAPTAREDIIDVLCNSEFEFRAAGVTTPLRLAHFLAQICVETGGLKSLSENMNYSAKRITQVWPSRFRTLASAQPFANNPQKLANKVYGGRLGNREIGDGWLFRGGGMLQTTGRYNYGKAGHENDPEALRQPRTALSSALKYWTDHKINEVADLDMVSMVRKRINGGSIGLDEARRYLKRAKDALGA